MLVEYSPVTIAGKTYICPLKSVTINVFYPACATTEIAACGALAYVRGFKTQAFLIDVNFSQYHVFRADSRILVAGSLPPKDEVNAEPVAPNAGMDPRSRARGKSNDGAAGHDGHSSLRAHRLSFAVRHGALAKASIKPADVSSLPAIAAPPHSTSRFFTSRPVSFISTWWFAIATTMW